MFLFILLLILLILSIVFFVGFPIVKRKLIPEKFKSFCERKIKHIASKNNYLYLSNLNLTNLDLKKIDINHILFGEKFIYIFKEMPLVGEISGVVDDNSWIYSSSVEKTTKYIDNISHVLNENIQDFAGIININPQLIVSICVVPNECDLLIKDINKANLIVTHYSSLKGLINKIESISIAPIDKEKLIQDFELINEKNNEQK